MYLCTGCENVAVDKDVERPLVHNDDGEDNKVKSNEQLNKTNRLEYVWYERYITNGN